MNRIQASRSLRYLFSRLGGNKLSKKKKDRMTVRRPRVILKMRR